MPNIVYEWQGRALTNFFTYMAWQLITDPTSEQYRFRAAVGQNFDVEGFAVAEGRYVIACTAPEDGGLFGTIGDRIDWTLADGTVLKTIVGDTKDPGDAEWIPLGHLDEVGSRFVCVVEFVVDQRTWYDRAHGGQAATMHANPGNPGCHPEWAGQIKSFSNRGNYWGGPVSGEDGTPGVAGRTSPITYISPEGADMLAVHFEAQDPLLFYRSNSIWRPRESVSLPSGDTPTVVPTGAWSRAAEALAWCRANRELWPYLQPFTDGDGVYRGPGLNRGNGCDCSGFIGKMLYNFAPATYRAVFNTRTRMPDTWELWYWFAKVWDSATAPNPDTAPVSLLQPGDLALFASGWGPGEGFPETYGPLTKRHVFIYMADGLFWDVVKDNGPDSTEWGIEQTPQAVWDVRGWVSATRWCIARPDYGAQ